MISIVPVCILVSLQALACCQGQATPEPFRCFGNVKKTFLDSALCATNKPFNIDTDIMPERIALKASEAIRESVSRFGSDVSLITWITALEASAVFDAIAPYHPTATGIYSNLGRRPISERTIQNKNIAALYCILRVLGNAIPDQEQRFANLLREAGLDPSDVRESEDSPIGIGNLCGKKINEAAGKDGMNSKGDMGKDISIYNREPFRDFTNYKPINPEDKIVDATKWQPAVSGTNGVFKTQKFITPQMGKAKPYSYSNVDQFKAKPHGRLLKGQNGTGLYKSTTDEVIKESANLTDYKKMAAEFFSDKLCSAGHSSLGTIVSRKMSYDDFVFYELVINIAAFDTMIAIWKEKVRWNAVRPFTAIRHLYGDNNITAYDKAGRKTVKDMPASAWNSYLPVSDHPEYPSATAGYCGSFAEALRIWFNSEQTLMAPISILKGSSRIELGVTPSKDVSLKFETWSDFETTCAYTRVWAGVHFVDAIEEGKKIGKKIGKLAVDFVNRHIKGIPAPVSTKPPK